MDPKKDSIGGSCRSLGSDAMDDPESVRSLSYEPSFGGENIFGNSWDEAAIDDIIASECVSNKTDFGFERVEGASTEDLVNASPQDQPRSSEPQIVSGQEWNTMLSHAFATSTNFTASLAFPWETGTMRAVFGDSHIPQFATALGDFTDLSRLRPADESGASAQIGDSFDSQVKPAFLYAVKSLRDVDFIDEKKSQLSLAAAKWMELLSIDWRASSVGQQIALDMQGDPSGDLAEQSLKAVFGVKSPSTLLKRAASLKQYVAWFQRRCLYTDSYISPFPLAECDVWAYFLHLRALRRENQRGYTVGATFLETIRFCKFVIGLYRCEDLLESKRLLGFAAVEKREKGPLKQAPSMEVEHLLRLHSILEHGANKVDRIGAGAFLCAIYARARWSDLRFIHHIKYDGFKRNATMDLYTAEHKTSSAGLRREQFLPLVIPSEGIVAGDWLGIFIDLCHQEGVDWERVPFGPLLPAPKSDGGWCARPLSTAEAAEWLRRLLEGCNNASLIRAHSMKVTLCIWAARAGFSKEHRATLSHHSTALHGSDIVYSRDLQSGAIRKLQMMLKKIRIGLNPSADAMHVTELTAPFDAGHTSVVRTPVLNPHAPATPIPPTAADVPEQDDGSGQAEELVSRLRALEGSEKCKHEDFSELCIEALDKFSDHDSGLQGKGLIEIESSSGSSSETDSSSDDDSSSEHFQSAVPHPAYTEHVPEGLDFVAHRKSMIMHKAKPGAEVTFCKTRLTGNFFVVERVFHFKYPKCMRCFTTDGNRLKTVEAVASHLDEMSKKRKA